MHMGEKDVLTSLITRVASSQVESRVVINGGRVAHDDNDLLGNEGMKGLNLPFKVP